MKDPRREMKEGEEEKYDSHAYLRRSINTEKLIHFSGISREGVALDLCCGAAHSAIAFAPHVRKIVAVDNDEAMLERARRNLDDRGIKNVETLRGDATQLEFDDAAFDVVVARCAFRHVDDYRKAMAECHRVLRPRGKLFVTDIALLSEAIELWKEISRWRTGTEKHYWTYNSHLRELRERGFEPLLALPTRHEQDLSQWLAEIDSEHESKEYEKKIFSLPDEIKRELYLSDAAPYSFTYDVIELLLERVDSSR